MAGQPFVGAHEPPLSADFTRDPVLGPPPSQFAVICTGYTEKPILVNMIRVLAGIGF